MIGEVAAGHPDARGRTRHDGHAGDRRPCDPSVGGAWHLWKAIDAEVRREFEQELATASFWQRRMIQRKIRLEVKRRMRGVASPHSLYFSARIFGRFIDLRLECSAYFDLNN